MAAQGIAVTQTIAVTPMVARFSRIQFVDAVDPPTVTEGSEIIATFNPELETDENYQRFALTRR